MSGFHIVCAKADTYDRSMIEIPGRQDLRPWQVEALDSAVNPVSKLLYDYYAVKAIGGAGKSFFGVAFAVMEGNLRTRQKLPMKKQLFCVPRRNISDGFDDATMIFKKGRKIGQLVINNNLCEATQEKKGLSINLKAFLLEPPKVGNLNWIVSHQLLVLVWNSMRPEERREFVKNIRIHIDECHHLTDAVEDKWSSELGKAFVEMCDFKEPTFSANIYSATHFRGDFRNILSIEGQDMFHRYTLSMSEYWPTLGISDFCYDYVFYPQGIEIGEAIHESLLAAISARPLASHLIIVPALGGRNRTDGSVNIILATIKKALPEARILDLVNDDNRDVAIKRLQDNPNSYNVVIACQLFDEGFDWPVCSDVHDLSARASQQLAVQIMCRAIRKSPGKKSVKINVYIPEPRRLDKDTVRDLYSDRYNALLGLLAADEYIRPFIVKCPSGCSISLADIMGEDAYSDFTAEIVKMQEKRIFKGKEVDQDFIDSVAEMFYREKMNIKKEDFRFYVEAKINRMARVSEGREMGTAVDVDDNVVEASDLRKMGIEFDRIRDKGRRGRSWVLGSLSGLSAELFQLYKNAVNSLQKNNKKLANERHEMVELAADYHATRRELSAAAGPAAPKSKVKPGDWVSLNGKPVRVERHVDGAHVEVATYPRVRSLVYQFGKGCRRWRDEEVTWREDVRAWVPDWIDKWSTEETRRKWTLPDDAKVMVVKLEETVSPA